MILVLEHLHTATLQSMILVLEHLVASSSTFEMCFNKKVVKVLSNLDCSYYCEI